MRRALNTLVGRLATLRLLIYAVLLPALFFGLDAVARRNAVDTFTGHARGYANSLARELERGDTLYGVKALSARCILGLTSDQRLNNCVLPDEFVSLCRAAIQVDWVMKRAGAVSNNLLWASMQK